MELRSTPRGTIMPLLSTYSALNLICRLKLSFQNRLRTKLRPVSINIDNRYWKTKSPKIGLIFKILNKILMKPMQNCSFWQFWIFGGILGMCAKPIISKIKFERTDIELNFKSWHHAALDCNQLLMDREVSYHHHLDSELCETACFADIQIRLCGFGVALSAEAG